MLKSRCLHDGWQFIETRFAQKRRKLATCDVPWLNASVPGHVHCDLVDAGVIDDPFWRLNELGCQWVDETDWTYRLEFQWNPDPSLPRRVLQFEGLDTICSISLNGRKLLESSNMFVPVEADVSQELRAGLNELQIAFKSSVVEGRKSRLAYLKAEGIDAKSHAFAERGFVRKAQYMFGWDWGPRLVSCGIWKPVRLIEFDSRLRDVAIRCGIVGGKAILDVQSEVDGIGKADHDLLFAGQWVQKLVEGRHEIKGALLWEPSGVGQQHRYVLRSNLIGETGEGQTVEHTVGFCDYRLAREADPFGESFQLSVNGRLIWCRGANWIPDHSFPSQITAEQYRHQIRRACDLGFNMLRVWGGGLYEADAFYDACDEFGVMVWQDFPFACGYYPDGEEAQASLAIEATANIRRLRCHPSLAMWCGNNENHQMWVQNWHGADKPPRFYGLALYREALPKVLKAEDPSRPYIEGSPTGPVKDSLEETNSGGVGDQHNWDVWHGRGDWRFYSDSTARFSSEFGFASSCSLAVWQDILNGSDWEPHSSAVQWHDKTSKGHETFRGFVELHYPKSKALEDWVYYSQLNQRDALRHGIEHYRRSEFCKGSLVWQFNDCWPVQSWAVVDSSGSIKPAGYELRRVYADFLLSIVRDNANVELWAVLDDAPESIDDTATLTAFNTVTGDVIWRHAASVKLTPGERKTVVQADVTGLNVRETILFAQCGEAQCWQLLCEPKSLALPEPAPISVSRSAIGGVWIETAPVIDLVLTDGGSTQAFIDNVLTIPGGGKRFVRTSRDLGSIEARSLAGSHSVQVTLGPLV